MDEQADPSYGRKLRPRQTKKEAKEAREAKPRPKRAIMGKPQGRATRLRTHAVSREEWMEKPPRGILPNAPLWGEFAVGWEDEAEFERAAEQEETQRMAQEETGRGGARTTAPWRSRRRLRSVGTQKA